MVPNLTIIRHARSCVRPRAGLRTASRPPRRPTSEARDEQGATPAMRFLKPVWPGSGPGGRRSHGLSAGCLRSMSPEGRQLPRTSRTSQHQPCAAGRFEARAVGPELGRPGDCPEFWLAATSVRTGDEEGWALPPVAGWLHPCGEPAAHARGGHPTRSEWHAAASAQIDAAQREPLEEASVQLAAVPGSSHLGSPTIRDGRQPIIGSIGNAWTPATTAAAPAAAAEEPQQQDHHQQQCEHEDDHDHVVFLRERPSDLSLPQPTVPRC